ncbi:MAG: TetR/AcrR family transcriptional regulator [Pseudomonadota bacterium]|nr:TetR/AcrR family transcriptional regulator [Pseudomonadota bacterium]
MTDQSTAQIDTPGGNTRTAVLEKALELFAETGFNGVSMRRIAQEVGINPATLYHHFTHKEDLYEQVLRFAYAEQAAQFSALVSTEGTPRSQLGEFIREFTRYIAKDQHFFRLVKREQLEGNSERLKMLVDLLFGQQYGAMVRSVGRVTQAFDAHMLVTSLLGLVLHHYETRHMRQFFSEYAPSQDDPDVVADHCCRLFFFGIQGEAGAGQVPEPSTHAMPTP